MDFNKYSYFCNFNNDFSRQIKSILLNFGPQHPAAHGVLRLTLQLTSETIDRVDAQIGFLHRGTEKLITYKNIISSLPYFDRLDYTSVMTQTHAYCLSIEKLFGFVDFISLNSWVRVLFDELARLLNHFLAIGTHSLDVGNMSPVLWSFEEREKLMEMFEYISGSRMHTALYLPCDFRVIGITYEFLIKILYFARNCYKYLIEIFSVLYSNRIWKVRLINIGLISSVDCLFFGITGPLLRSSGIRRDLRLSNIFEYSAYSNFCVNSYIGSAGDSYDRFLVRIREMFESLRIIFITISILSNNSFLSIFNNFILKNLKNSFKLFLKNYCTNILEVLFFKTNFNFLAYFDKILLSTYGCVEAGKGEFGSFIFFLNNLICSRCHIRSPAYYNLQSISRLVCGHYLADLVTIIGSLDIVFGEIDR